MRVTNCVEVAQTLWACQHPPYIGCLDRIPLAPRWRNGSLKIGKRSRRTSTKEFKQEAVQMVLDGHYAPAVSENIDIGNANLIYSYLADESRIHLG